MRQRTKVLLLQIELFLGGLLLCGIAGFAVKLGINDGANWGRGRIGLMAGGVCLLILGIVIGLPKTLEFLMDKRIKRIGVLIIYISQACGWCFIGFLALEILLRLTFFNYPLFWIRTNIGDVPVENSVEYWAQEGFAFTHYEEFGEIATPLKGNNPIILLGDSHSEGLQVPDWNKFASIAEMTLFQSGKDFDIHNFSASNLSLADYISYIPLYKSTYHPIGIVVQLTSYDFVESFSTSKFNYFIEKNGKIVDLIHRKDLSAGFITSSGPLIKISSMAIYLTENRLKEFQKDTTTNTETINKFNFDLAKQQMDELVRVCDGTPLILVLLPYTPNIYQDQINEDDPDFENLLKLVSNYPSISSVNPFSDFVNLTKNGALPRGFFNSSVPGSGHLNLQGNEIVGRLLADAILKALP